MVQPEPLDSRNVERSRSRERKVRVVESDEETVTSTNKRTLSQTTIQQEKQTNQEKPHENNERVTKKPFSSHGIRRAKRKVRFVGG